LRSQECAGISKRFSTFDPPVTSDEIRASSLQFVSKISGFNKPSKANEAAFLAAVDEIEAVSSRFLHSLETNASPRNREEKPRKRKFAPQQGSAIDSAERAAPRS